MATILTASGDFSFQSLTIRMITATMGLVGTGGVNVAAARWVVVKAETNRQGTNRKVKSGSANISKHSASLPASRLALRCGKLSRVPRWMQYIDAAWLYRLYQEPKRLFRRYLTDSLDSLFLLRNALGLRKLRKNA